MLSKVMKNARNRQVPNMVFAAAVAPVYQARHSPVPAGPGEVLAGAHQLMERIHALEAGLASAKRDAFDAGFQEGEQQARTQLAPIVERMNAAVAAVIEMRPELRRRAEKDAVDLSLQIARRVLHRELSIDSNAMNALARVIFDRLARMESWHLTVHPRFAEAIRGALPASSAARVQIEADASCAPGTLLVRYADGVVDASIDSQLEEIGRGLADRLIRK